MHFDESRWDRYWWVTLVGRDDWTMIYVSLTGTGYFVGALDGYIGEEVLPEDVQVWGPEIVPPPK